MKRITKFKVKCSSCGKVKELTEKEIKDANALGACMCDICYMPMFPVEVKGVPYD